MLQNFLYTAFRNFRRNGLYTALNLTGLTVGFAGFLLLGLYITDELRFDAMHTKADRIFRLVEAKTDADGKTSRIAATSYLAAERGKQDLPEIAETVKIGATGRSNIYVSDPRQAFHVQVWHADSGFGQVFDFQWIAGDRNTALVAPYSAVLSQGARRLFGTDQVAGKTLTIEGFRQPLTVTGVLADFPKNSSIHFEIAVSTSTYEVNDFMIKAKASNWTSHNFPTWILLQPDADPAAVEAN
ncbi:MAG: ABC transporter permease [Lewinellaceae bacterium]|nr:ABC transporter permease [Lewinellaceae bacterium]